MLGWIMIVFLDDEQAAYGDNMVDASPRKSF